MRRILASALIFACLLLPANGAGWLPLVKAGATYTGPIDVNGTAYAFWSTRCGAAAYSGNILDIWDGSTGSTTETVLGCDGAGNIVVKSGSALATTCSVSCRVKIIYDQSGGGNCSGACDLTQATNANRPTYTTSLLGGKDGIAFNSATPNCLQGPGSITSLAQALSASTVYKSLSGSIGTIIAGAAGVTSFYKDGSGANQLNTYAGGGASLDATASDASSHAAQWLLSGASSAVYVDGSNTTGTNPGTGAFTTVVTLGSGGNNVCLSGTNFADLNFFEFGLWSGDKSANNSTMNSNQHTYWGF